MGRIIFILLPTILLASETDIVPRTINFVVFVAIMYYFTANKIKVLYKSRIENIQNRLVAIEKELEEAKKNKDNIAKRIEKANQEANDMIALAKVQADKIGENILKDVESEISQLEKIHCEQKVFDERRAKLEVVNELLDEMLNSNINLKQKELLDVISKKVS